MLNYMIDTLKKTNTCTNTRLTMYDRNTHANCKSRVQLIMQPWYFPLLPLLSSLHLQARLIRSWLFSQNDPTFIPEGSESFVILSVLGCCSFPLTLTIGHGSNQEKPSRTSCALNNLFYLNCEEAIWINHPS